MILRAARLGSRVARLVRLAAPIVLTAAPLMMGVPLARAAETESAPERIVIAPEKLPPPDEENGAGTELLDPARRFNFEGFRVKIDALWFKRKALLEKNLTDAAEEQIDAMEDLGREVGVTRIETIAAGLVHEGQGFLKEGNFDKASRSFRDAQRFASDLPDSHFGLAAASWRASSFGESASEIVAGLRGLLQSRTMSSAVLGNLLIIAILAIAATAVLISVAMILRYHTLVRHDLLETMAARSPGRFSKEMLALLGWLLVALPLVTWIAALWTPAYWLTLTFRYQNAREKTISAILFVLMLLSAPATRSAEILFALAADPSARLMLASTSLSYDPEQVVVLVEKAEANPQDPAYRFLLGSVYSQGRYFDDALAEYRKVVALDPKSYRAINNIGNIYLSTGQPDVALKHYAAALELRKDFLPSYYNIYLARKEMLQLPEAESALKEGQAINPAGMARIIDLGRIRGSGDPVDATISRDEVFARILGAGREDQGVMSAFMSLPALIVGLFFAAAVVIWRTLGARPAKRCVKCGEPFCARCKVMALSPEYCTQCQQVFVRRDGLSSVARRQKMTDLERFRISWARLSRICALLIPGMSRLLDGRTLSGAFASGVWCATILALVLRPSLLNLPGAGDIEPYFAVTVLLALLAAAAWLAGNFKAVRDARAPAGSWRWH